MTARNTSDRAITTDLGARVRARFVPAPNEDGWRGGVVLDEVEHWGDAARPDAPVRRIDHVAVDFRRGPASATVVGFEVKASRPDWRRELEDPSKAAAWGTWCNEWWIVAPVGVVRDGELPDGWGLLVPYGRGLRVVVPATYRPITHVPIGMVRVLMAKMDGHRAAEMISQANRHRRALDEAQSQLVLGDPTLDAGMVADARAMGQLLAAAGIKARPWGLLDHAPDTRIGRALLAIVDGLVRAFEILDTVVADLRLIGRTYGQLSDAQLRTRALDGPRRIDQALAVVESITEPHRESA